MSAHAKQSVEAFAQALVEEALAKGASAAQARAVDGDYVEMQFNNRGVDLVRSVRERSAAITVYKDDKRGAASLNGDDAAEVSAAIDSAMIAAEAGLPDPANDVAAAESLPPSAYGPQAADRARMAESIEAFLDRLERDFPLIRTRDCNYNFYESEIGFANSKGLRQKERRARYGFSALFMAKDGAKTTSMNYSGASSFEPFNDPFRAGSLERLLEETTRSLERKPAPEKFVGDVIVTPDCLASLLGPIVGALSGSDLFAGTSPFKNRKGEAIASPLFSLSNHPLDRESPGGADFDDFGVPTRNIEVVEKGVLYEYLVDFFFSKKLGVPQTAGAYRLSVASGETSLEEIVANTKRGILFARFSGGAPNGNLDFTGIAKNSFYVEDGKIRHALEETMVSGNFQELLKNIHTVSRETVDFGSGSYPFLAASGVTISSK
jgi:PmbA protein